ncbi:MAG: hypothetical protein ACREFX_14020 [Opitutaceae bacterium]
MSEPLPVELPAGFRPKTGTCDQWNAAYVRVEEYLRAHRMHSRLHQVRLVQRILERAAARHAADPAADPTELAAGEMEAELDAWFAEILGEPERAAIDGRVALLLSDGMRKWPDVFLEDPIPPEFARALRESSMQAGPDMAVSSMVPRPIELGRLSEAAGETLERFERWPILRTLILWLVFVAALVVLFGLTR